MFVVVEGIEGSGKSTLLSALAERLRAGGRDVLTTREPGGTPVGDAIREIFLRRGLSICAMTESLLLNAARAQHVAEVIRPALEAGRMVLCDRFTDSTLAYQGYGRGADLETLGAVCKIATGGLEPDLVLQLDIPVGVARERLRGRRAATDRIEAEDDAFHERVREGFRRLAGSPRHRILDAALPSARILEQALDEVKARLSLQAS
ncbi:MAG: dTMP kinase [Candidatus Eremiobacteraeota bacterium]|nr:dTMP kinase [Candidatus Eremiobacteraeota bacterium]